MGNITEHKLSGTLHDAQSYRETKKPRTGWDRSLRWMQFSAQVMDMDNINTDHVEQPSVEYRPKEPCPPQLCRWLNELPDGFTADKPTPTQQNSCDLYDGPFIMDEMTSTLEEMNLDEASHASRSYMAPVFMSWIGDVFVDTPAVSVFHTPSNSCASSSSDGSECIGSDVQEDIEMLDSREPVGGYVLDDMGAVGEKMEE
ncbi:hypothetical protein FDECE_16245 [Fusarium decemcellulare]|nr:hypothetical protein FDECE_16245 [Fusarium decemcellulare]